MGVTATLCPVIKSHHNVGGLPADVRAKFIGGLVEPLRMLFKDEVRRVGEELGMPHDMVWRQPFPGPGLAIRIMGDITPDKLETVRESDAILREEVALAGLDRDINQYFTVLTNTRTVGVMGDERTHDFVLAIRAVTTDDFMTVDWARLPYDLLAKVSDGYVLIEAYSNDGTDVHGGHRLDVHRRRGGRRARRSPMRWLRTKSVQPSADSRLRIVRVRLGWLASSTLAALVKLPNRATV